MSAKLSQSLGLFMRDVAGYSVKSRNQEIALFRRVQQGDGKAREEAILCNVRLVVRIAKGFQHRGIALDDLIQEGNLGLMVAVERFNPELEVPFSGYAAWWIRNTVLAALARYGSIVRMPRKKKKRIFFPASVSLDEVADLDEGRDLHEKLETTGVPSVLTILEAREELLEARQRMLHTVRCLDELGVSPRDKSIFKEYVGMGIVGRPQTLEALGKEHHITRERARQIQENVWKKLAEAGVPHDVGSYHAEIRHIDALESCLGITSASSFEATCRVSRKGYLLPMMRRKQKKSRST